MSRCQEARSPGRVGGTRSPHCALRVTGWLSRGLSRRQLASCSGVGRGGLWPPPQGSECLTHRPGRRPQERTPSDESMPAGVGVGWEAGESPKGLAVPGWPWRGTWHSHLADGYGAPLLSSQPGPGAAMEPALRAASCPAAPGPSLSCGTDGLLSRGAAASPTRLVGAPRPGIAPGPVSGGVEGGNADQVAGVAGQVLQLHRGLGQEQHLHLLRVVLAARLPVVDLQREQGSQAPGRGPLSSCGR